MSWNKIGTWHWGRKDCPICGTKFNAKIGHIREATTCGYSCSNTFFRSGKNNPNWKHGRTRIVDRSVMKDYCEICGITEKLCYDHNHATGEYRGTLCSNCNRALGFLHDNPNRCKAAEKYLLERKTGYGAVR